MAKEKKRGPKPRKGLEAPGGLIGVKCTKGLLTRLDGWRNSEDDKPGRPEAIRRLVEIALAGGKPTKKLSKKAAAKASDLAGREIDRLSDQSTSVKEQQRRKHRLLKGPPEFRDIRSDNPKARR